MGLSQKNEKYEQDSKKGVIEPFYEEETIKANNDDTSTVHQLRAQCSERSNRTENWPIFLETTYGKKLPIEQFISNIVDFFINQIN